MTQQNTISKKPKIAIIGGGIAGLTAALTCSQNGIAFALFEKNTKLGGHCHTHNILHDHKKLRIDTAFVVFNKRNYPNYTRLLKHLNIETQKAPVSFAVSVDNGQFEWCAHPQLWPVFAAPSNLINLRFHKMLINVLRFNNISKKELAKNNINGSETLREFLIRHNLGAEDGYFLKYYLSPLATSVWSVPAEKILSFPAKNTLNFFHHHGLLTIRPNAWYTVKNGSRQVVKAIEAQLPPESVKVGCTIQTIQRNNDHIIITDQNGDKTHFDALILCVPADQAYTLLGDATQEEQDALSAFNYIKNVAILHTDQTYMPKRKRAWAAWNLHKSSQNALQNQNVQLTHWMNTIQKLKIRKNIFLTLNPQKRISEEYVFTSNTYSHPVFDASAKNAQITLKRISGQNKTYFAGAWLGMGFHEDAVTSALECCKALNLKIHI